MVQNGGGRSSKRSGTINVSPYRECRRHEEMDSFHNIRTFGMTITPLGQSVISMSLSMAMNFSGYEFARSTCLALFTSSETGFVSSSAFPTAMAFVTPVSYLLLMGYERILDTKGPRLALRYTTLSSFISFFSFGSGLKMIRWATEVQGNNKGNDTIIILSLIGKSLVWMAFVFQNCYCHLLSTQHWSFVGSVLTPAQGASWFACLSGISSLTSSFAGSMVSHVVSRIGLEQTLSIVTNLFLLLSLFFAEHSYSISEKYSFSPSSNKEEKTVEQKEMDRRSSFFKKATDLFTRVPSLKLLFYEVLTFQTMATILNIRFVKALKSVKTNDLERAGWSGKFYAIVNGVSAFLQFLAVPFIMKYIEPSVLCQAIPVVFVLITSFQCLKKMESDLSLVSVAFLAAKAIDYSFRGVINEMVYIPLDFDSRFLGKEVISMLGNRMGKASISLLLAFYDFEMETMSWLAAASSFSWMIFANYLSQAVPKIDAELVKR